MKRLALPALATAALAVAPAAFAQAPANDNRANAQRLGSPPLTVSGTTAGATRENNDPGACSQTTGSVWYRLDGTGEGRLIVRFDAGGDLDATVIVLRRVRSEISFVTCANTDDKGNAQFSFATADEGNYLFMVGQRATSQPGSFRLSLLVPERPARAPGDPLPRRGVTTTVDTLLDQDDAWSTVMRPGQTYRINLVTGRDRCVFLALFRPGTRSFDTANLRSRGCGGYMTFTPGPDGGGLYTLLVTARSGRGELQYHLQVARAGRDDTSPGLPLRNLEERPGILAGRSVDVVDLYRFQVGARSDVVLTLAAGERMQTDLALLNDRGQGSRSTDAGARSRSRVARSSWPRRCHLRAPAAAFASRSTASIPSRAGCSRASSPPRWARTGSRASLGPHPPSAGGVRARISSAQSRAARAGAEPRSSWSASRSKASGAPTAVRC